MLHVSALNDKTVAAFCALFKDYYSELGCDDDTDYLLKEYVLPDRVAGLISIDIIEDDGKAAGFCVYQIDGIENEWNFKEGWGDLREIYVAPAHRRKGLGKLMLFTAEYNMKNAGAGKCYCLPFEGAEQFFTACGYKKTDEYSAELDCAVYEKLSLDNCDCKRNAR